MKNQSPLLNATLVIFFILYIVFETFVQSNPILSRQPVWAKVMSSIFAIGTVMLFFFKCYVLLYLRFSKKPKTEQDWEEIAATYEILYAIADTAIAFNRDKLHFLLKDSRLKNLNVSVHTKISLEQQLRKLMKIPENHEEEKNIRKEIGEILVSEPTPYRLNSDYTE